MNIECSSAENGDVNVKLMGEMDALGCTHIRPELEEITDNENTKNVTLDFTKVNFLDSSGVGVIVFLFKRLKARGYTLNIDHVHDQPRELMELLRINTVIPISDESSVVSYADQKHA